MARVKVYFIYASNYNIVREIRKTETIIGARMESKLLRKRYPVCEVEIFRYWGIIEKNLSKENEKT